ncbi:MAG: hypothetical protein D6720_05850, partial [Gammaproteobacteria bacterium]
MIGRAGIGLPGRRQRAETLQKRAAFDRMRQHLVETGGYQRRALPQSPFTEAKTVEPECLALSTACKRAES